MYWKQLAAVLALVQSLNISFPGVAYLVKNHENWITLQCEYKIRDKSSFRLKKLTAVVQLILRPEAILTCKFQSHFV